MSPLSGRLVCAPERRVQLKVMLPTSTKLKLYTMHLERETSMADVLRDLVEDAYKRSRRSED